MSWRNRAMFGGAGVKGASLVTVIVVELIGIFSALVIIGALTSQ